MKILVTGSSGHLGEALVRTLRQEGHEVIGLDIKASAFTTVAASVHDSACVRECMRGVQLVYHTATLHKPHVAQILECLKTGDFPGSPLAKQVGSKGYHDEVFDDGPYPV